MDQPSEKENKQVTPNSRLVGFWQLHGLFRRKKGDTSDFDRDLQLMSRKRDKTSLFICGVLFMLIATFLVIVGWQRQYSDAYLATKAAIKSFDNYKQEWQVSSARKTDCGSQDVCYQKMVKSDLKVISFEKLVEPWRDFQAGVADEEPIYILVRTIIDKAAWKKFYDEDYKRLVVGMPTAWYESAHAYVNGQLMGTFLKGARVGVPVLLEESAPEKLVIDVLYLRKWNFSGLFDPNDEPLLITSSGEYNSWVRTLIMQSASRGSWVSDLAFIVMGAFFLLLFLFVDSSPEVLGLAMFVSLDAAARSFTYGWIPWGYTDQLSDTLDSASQVMRLYFLLQLGRIGFSRVGPWLVFAFVYSLIASAGSWSDALGWKLIPDRTYEINVWFALFVSLFGIGISVPTAVKIRRKQLPWRQWALVIAAAACTLQCIAYINYIWPEIANYNEFFRARSVILPLSVYLLASSAFVNISSLENRVRSLSNAKARNEIIEKELELGRVVQNAYMKIPSLPSEIDMSCYFEAAFYVSGDSYFIHWDPEPKRLTVILGDMTGHGVHAALKATALQVIARTIFRDPMRRGGELGSRFMVYEQTLRSFLRESWGDGDIPTFLGLELDVASGHVVSHRSNFPFPIVVYQTDGGQWDIKVWADMGQTIDFRANGRRAYVISATDGIISSSKQLSRVAAKLKIQLNLLPEVNSKTIKEQLLLLQTGQEAAVDDDKTMVVFGLKSNNDAA